MARRNTTTQATKEVTDAETTTEATTEETTMTVAELAAELGTDPKSFRRWLRTQTDDRAGKGGRWKFDDAAAAKVRTAWADKANAGTTPTLPDADSE